jgi:hypothetical protein
MSCAVLYCSALHRSVTVATNWPGDASVGWDKDVVVAGLDWAVGIPGIGWGVLASSLLFADGDADRPRASASDVHVFTYGLQRCLVARQYATRRDAYAPCVIVLPIRDIDGCNMAREEAELLLLGLQWLLYRRLANQWSPYDAFGAPAAGFLRDIIVVPQRNDSSVAEVLTHNQQPQTQLNVGERPQPSHDTAAPRLPIAVIHSLGNALCAGEFLPDRVLGPTNIGEHLQHCSGGCIPAMLRAYDAHCLLTCAGIVFCERLATTQWHGAVFSVAREFDILLAGSRWNAEASVVQAEVLPIVAAPLTISRAMCRAWPCGQRTLSVRFIRASTRPRLRPVPCGRQQLLLLCRHTASSSSLGGSWSTARAKTLSLRCVAGTSLHRRDSCTSRSRSVDDVTVAMMVRCCRLSSGFATITRRRSC